MRSLAWREYSSLVLLALLVCLAAACKGGHGSYDDDEDEEKAECILDRVTEEELNSFNPDIPLTEGSGQSDAFEMHPLEEMIISAPVGAFDQNPNIHVNVASGQQLQAAEDKLAELMPDHELLWGYDIDAGLPSDSVLPGKYTVKIDLKKLDIPEELHPAIRLVRMDDKGNLQQLNSRVKNGVIRYEACQNSVVSMTICVGGLIVVTGAAIANGTIGLPIRTKMKLQGMLQNDMIEVPVKDAFGDFNVLFRYSQTECGNRAKEYFAKNDELEKRLATLEKKAQKDYDKEHPTKSIFQWLDNALEKKKRRVGREKLFCQYANEDSKVQELLQDPDIELPQSVQDIIKATRLANRFSRDTLGLGMKPLSYTYNVFLVPQSEMGKDEKQTKAKFQPLWFNRGGQILVSYDFYLKKKDGKLTYDPKNLDATSVTMAHEIGHAFETEYIRCILFTNSQFFEAIGSVTEHWFTSWMKKRGYIDIEDTESKEAVRRFDYANHDVPKQLYAWPLELDYPKEYVINDKPLIGEDMPSMNGGYMLGDLVQYLCEHKKKVTFDDIMKGYAYNKNFLQNLKDIFDIKSNSEFTPFYEQLCMKHMSEIALMQGMYDYKAEGKNLLISPIEHSPAKCVHRIEKLGHNGTTKAYPFAVKVVRIEADRNNTTPYSLFAVPKGKFWDRELMFTFLEGDSLQQAKDSLFVTPCEKEYNHNAKAAIIYREFASVPTFDKDCYIDVVVLYQPKEPKVLGTTKDGTGLNVHTGDKPAAKLLQDPENPYVTGMQMVVINNKTKKKKLFNVPLEQCGQEVKIPFASVGIKDPDDIDISVRTRWYYENKFGGYYYSPAAKRVNYKRQKEQEAQTQGEAGETEEGFNTHSDENVSQDQGDAAMTKNFRLNRLSIVPSTYNGSYPALISRTNYKEEGVLAYVTIKLKDGRFKITVPDIEISFGKIGKVIQTQKGFTITGKYLVDDGKEQLTNGQKVTSVVLLLKDELQMTPSTFSLRHEGDKDATTLNFTQSPSQTGFVLTPKGIGRIEFYQDSQNKSCASLFWKIDVHAHAVGWADPSGVTDWDCALDCTGELE